MTTKRHTANKNKLNDIIKKMQHLQSKTDSVKFYKNHKNTGDFLFNNCHEKGSFGSICFSYCKSIFTLSGPELQECKTVIVGERKAAGWGGGGEGAAGIQQSRGGNRARPGEIPAEVC